MTLFGKFFNNNEISKSLEESVNDKVSSPIYGVFIISWTIFHWKLIYTAFFVSEEKIWLATGGMLKNDYLAQTFFNFSDLHFYLLWILPVIATYLIIWKFPIWISIPAFEISQKFEMQKLDIKFKNKTDLLKRQLEITRVTEQKTEKELKIKTLDPTVGWMEELNQISPNSKDINAILDGHRAIYTNNGNYVTKYGDTANGYFAYIPPDSLARLDAMGLIEKSAKEKQIKFTEKGKFFIRNLQQKNLL